MIKMFTKAGFQEFIQAYKYIYSDPILTEGRNHPLFQAIQSHMKNRSLLQRFAMPSAKSIFFALIRSVIAIWLLWPVINRLMIDVERKYHVVIFGSCWLLFEFLILSYKSFYQPNEKYNGIQAIYGHNKVARTKAVDLWMTGISAREVMSVLCAERYSVLKKSFAPILVLGAVILLTAIVMLVIHSAISDQYLSFILIISAGVWALPICGFFVLSIPIIDQSDIHRKLLEDIFGLWKEKPSIFSPGAKYPVTHEPTVIVTSAILATLFLMLLATGQPAFFTYFVIICMAVMDVAIGMIFWKKIVNYESILNQYFKSAQFAYDDFHYALIEKYGVD